jgi:hypothetical protein
MDRPSGGFGVVVEEHVVEIEEGEVLEAAEAHEDEQPRRHQPEERPVAEGNAEGRDEHLAHVSKLALNRGSAVRDEDDRGEHRRQQDDADGRDRRLATELQQQPGSDSAARDPDQVGNSVVTGGVTALRRGNHVGEQALVRRLGSVGGELKQEVEQDEPPVVARERDPRQEEQVPHRAGGDERPPPAPRGDRAV